MATVPGCLVLESKARVPTGIRHGSRLASRSVTRKSATVRQHVAAPVAFLSRPTDGQPQPEDPPGAVTDGAHRTASAAAIPPSTVSDGTTGPLDVFKTVEGHMDKLLLTPAEAAAALGIGRSKVYELLRAGVLPSVRIGACRRIPADGLTSFVTTLQPVR